MATVAVQCRGTIGTDKATAHRVPATGAAFNLDAFGATVQYGAIQNLVSRGRSIEPDALFARVHDLEALNDSAGSAGDIQGGEANIVAVAIDGHRATTVDVDRRSDLG